MTTCIGLMSGTSMDGVDAVLVSFDGVRARVHATHTQPIPAPLYQQIARLSSNQGSPDDLGMADRELGSVFATAAVQVLNRSGIQARDVSAIGSHGQTLRHQPAGNAPFSLQIADPNVIAEVTGITTVADFRRRDMAAGGQGAPLAPAFHRAFFSAPGEARCVLNLGGIANITWLPGKPGEAMYGFDTGPANALMDAWCRAQTGQAYDADGDWAASGEVNSALLTDLLASEPYFSAAAPKSTGKEIFNLEWIRQRLVRHPDLAPEDVQRTLLALTITSIDRQLPATRPMTLYVCGGGVRNRLLMAELERQLQGVVVSSTQALGIDPQWVEATAFAWLAGQTLKGLAGNAPAVTGARGERILGAVYPGQGPGPSTAEGSD